MLYLGFARKRVKIRFLISSVSAGNMLPARNGLSGPGMRAVTNLDLFFAVKKVFAGCANKYDSCDNIFSMWLNLKGLKNTSSLPVITT
jgi:hypothetical protein